MQPQISVDADGKRDDEWSRCLVQIAEQQDRQAFARLFGHFAPLVKAFALSGSALAAAPSPTRIYTRFYKIHQYRKLLLECGMVVVRA